MKRLTMCTFAILVVLSGAWAQDTQAFGFQSGLVLGVDVVSNPDGTTTNWNNLGFQPDLALGEFGIGLDLSVRFHLMPKAGQAIEIYPGDWIPGYAGAKTTIADLYLPKIMYVRYGVRGKPLYAKLGSIEDLTLGNGFIVGNYANTRFLPSQRIFGLQLGVDGELFGFPYLGIEVLTGNLAKLDVLGARLYSRPLLVTGLPILKDMQIGATFATDTNPTLYASQTVASSAVQVFGVDLYQPLLKSEAFPLAAFAELAVEPKNRMGFMIGAGGSLVSVINYGIQLRAMSPGFIPSYFDANYDLFRAVKYEALSTTPTGDTVIGWLAKAGTSLAKGAISMDVTVDGPFSAIPVPTPAQPNPAQYPHVRAVASVKEGILGGIYFDFSYDKYFIGRNKGFFEDLINPTDAVIGASVNFKSGAAVFTLLYNLKYNPNPANQATGGFDITSSLQSSIKF